MSSTFVSPGHLNLSNVMGAPSNSDHTDIMEPLAPLDLQYVPPYQLQAHPDPRAELTEICLDL